jgi:hypothetical protein
MIKAYGLKLSLEKELGRKEKKRGEVEALSVCRF